MTSVRSAKYRKLSVGYTAAFLGVASSVGSLYAWLFPDLLVSVSWQAWLLVSLLLLYCLGLSIVVWIADTRTMSTAIEGVSVGGSPGLYEALPSLVRDALDKSDFREVIRLGEALSRPLFESGEFRSRLEIGRLTEEAAARVGARAVQYRTLIDAIGWSLIELGEFSEAESAILHGLEIAESERDAFYRAKAHRHLGAIERRRGNLDEAWSRYEKAGQIAVEISDGRDAKAMTAGITYAKAHLQFSRRDYSKALDLSEEAVRLFGDLNDIYREDMALVLKADVLVALRRPGHARDTYRAVIQSSKLNRESVHYIRAIVGLAELYLREQKHGEAARILAQLDYVEIADMPAFAQRLLTARLNAGIAS